MQIYVEHWEGGGGNDLAKLIIFDIWEDVTVMHCIFSVKNAFENLSPLW